MVREAREVRRVSHVAHAFRHDGAGDVAKRRNRRDASTTPRTRVRVVRVFVRVGSTRVGEREHLVVVGGVLRERVPAAPLVESLVESSLVESSGVICDEGVPDCAVDAIRVGRLANCAASVCFSPTATNATPFIPSTRLARGDRTVPTSSDGEATARKDSTREDSTREDSTRDSTRDSTWGSTRPFVRSIRPRRRRSSPSRRRGRRRLSSRDVPPPTRTRPRVR